MLWHSAAMGKMIADMSEEDEKRFIEKLLELDAEIKAVVKFTQEKTDAYRNNSMKNPAENGTALAGNSTNVPAARSRL